MSPTRAEPIGSLLRPQELKDAREAHEAGRLDPAEFKRIEDEAAAAAIALQERAGMEVVNDGEMRRGHFMGSLTEAIDGLGDVPAAPHQWHGSDEMEYSHVRAVTGRLRRVRSLVQEEFVFLRARAERPVKMTLPSPLMMQTLWSPEHSTAAYSDPFEMFADAAAILREEIAALVELGCESIQIDAPELALMVDESVREAFRGRGVDPDRMLGEGIEIINSVAELSGPRYGIHLCRGNRDGHWMAAGGYDSIAARLFEGCTNFQVFFLEYDDERSGTFEPLRAVPDDRQVFLGLVSTKHPELEEPDELLARIDEAAAFFPRERLGLSPQCGFASTVGGNPLTVEQEEAKLRLVADVAARAFDG
ncbi:MAG TPA: cobalamin-independent methionine synthase II family protein [Thermoleophilaceae bacterium]